MKFNRLILVGTFIFMIMITIFISNDIAKNQYKNEHSTQVLSVNENPIRKIKITEKEAVDKVKDYIYKSKKSIPPVVEVDSEDESKYFVHAYEILESHIATIGWYEVDIYSGKVSELTN